MTVNYPNQSVNTPNFFQEYFVKPITEGTGYNPVNTAAYALLLVVSAYLIFKFLKKTGYKINLRFLKATLPFVLLIGVWRSLTDAGVYPYGFLTTTPGLYVPVLAIFFPLVTLAKKLEDLKGWRYEWVYSGISLALLASQLIIIGTLIPTQLDINAVTLSLFYTLISCLPVLLLSKYWKLLKNKLNLYMILSHFFESSVTHVSIEYFNYFEQHVIPRTIFNLTGTSLSFYAWKALILGLVIYFLDKEEGSEELSNFVKIIFIIYGLTIGVRNLLRLSLGV